MYDTNTDGFGHVLPWLVSTYGCQHAEEGSKKHTRWLESFSTVAVRVDYHQDGIGKEHSCSSRSSTTLLIRHRSSRIFLDNWDRGTCDMSAFSFWPGEG